jgi:hypothetical protein
MQSELVVTLGNHKGSTAPDAGTRRRFASAGKRRHGREQRSNGKEGDCPSAFIHPLPWRSPEIGRIRLLPTSVPRVGREDLHAAMPTVDLGYGPDAGPATDVSPGFLGNSCDGRPDAPRGAAAGRGMPSENVDPHERAVVCPGDYHLPARAEGPPRLADKRRNVRRQYQAGGRRGSARPRRRAGRGQDDGHAGRNGEHPFGPNPPGASIARGIFPGQRAATVLPVPWSGGTTHSGR